MLTLFFSLFGLFITVSPDLAHAERPVPPHEGRYHLGADLSIFHSSANYKSDGNSQTLLSGASFDNEQFNVRGDYEVNNNWRVYGRFAVANTSAANGRTTTTNSGINDFGAGAQAWLFTPTFFLVPQVQFSYPFWRVNESSNTALIGEGAASAEVGGFAIWRLQPRVQPFGYLGYMYRDAGRSTLLPFQLGINWRPTRWWFEASIRGSRSMGKDTGPDTQGQHDVYLTRVDGGSYRFAGQGPSITELSIETGWRFMEGWHAFGGLAYTLAGSNAANGISGLVGFTWTGRGFETAAANRVEAEGSGKRFQPSRENYDESLFEENKPQVAPPRKKFKKSSNVDKMLKDTEKQLNQEPPPSE